ncbi:SH3 domain-containing protein [Haliangium sp.]|uniref:SH3 domain-containing protein n=1 Tax=Haliangium sp. TaxID=2663208 RepID=UPI003D0C77A3
MRVVVVSSRVEAFKEPAVDQDIAFLATQGQELVVRGFHEPDWMYVQTLDGKLGWIPKGSVRQKGNFVDARGTVGSGQVPDDTSEARDSRRSSADRGQDRSGDARRGSSGDGDGGDTGADAAMRNSSGSAGGGETQVSKRGDGGEAPSSLLAPEPPSPLSIELGSAVGVALVERTYAATNMGGAGYVASATTAATTVGGDIRYRVQGPWHVGIDGNWSVLAGLTGLAYDPATGESIDLGNFLQQRTELSAKFGFQEERFSAFVRAGGLIEIFYINDLLNDGALPRERLISGTAGVQLEVRPVAPLSLGLRADVLILGALAQTRGREDGDFDTVGLLAPIAQLDGSYAVAKHVVLRAGLRFDRLVPTWTGASVRAPGVNGAERTDQVIRLLLGVGARF